MFTRTQSIAVALAALLAVGCYAQFEESQGEAPDKPPTQFDYVRWKDIRRMQESAEVVSPLRAAFSKATGQEEEAAVNQEPEKGRMGRSSVADSIKPDGHLRERADGAPLEITRETELQMREIARSKSEFLANQLRTRGDMDAIDVDEGIHTVRAVMQTLSLAARDANRGKHLSDAVHGLGQVKETLDHNKGSFMKERARWIMRSSELVGRIATDLEEASEALDLANSDIQNLYPLLLSVLEKFQKMKDEDWIPKDQVEPCEDVSAIKKEVSDLRTFLNLKTQEVLRLKDENKELKEEMEEQQKTFEKEFQKCMRDLVPDEYRDRKAPPGVNDNTAYADINFDEIPHVQAQEVVCDGHPSGGNCNFPSDDTARGPQGVKVAKTRGNRPSGKPNLNPAAMSDPKRMEGIPPNVPMPQGGLPEGMDMEMMMKGGSMGGMGNLGMFAQQQQQAPSITADESSGPQTRVGPGSDQSTQARVSGGKRPSTKKKGSKGGGTSGSKGGGKGTPGYSRSGKQGDSGKPKRVNKKAGGK